MPRKPRSAPSSEPDPLDEYSTWDVRIARAYYYCFIASALIMVIGIWALILGGIDPEIWKQYLELDVGYQVAIVAAFITGHLILLVLFYAMFRGGIVRMCRTIYKNRTVAKKWEDYTYLRWLMGITILGIYVVVISLIIGLLPGGTIKFLSDLTLWAIENFNVGHWILWIGFCVFLVVLFFFIMFWLWNHGTYLVLRNIKKIEEEEAIDMQIRRESLKKMSEEERQAEYKKETGKDAVYRGKDTRGYRNWKKKYGV
ncbi:MAG: hypothetical protein ACFFDK_17210 [Promethearchaeota archaeon]